MSEYIRNWLLTPDPTHTPLVLYNGKKLEGLDVIVDYLAKKWLPDSTTPIDQKLLLFNLIKKETKLTEKTTQIDLLFQNLTLNSSSIASLIKILAPSTKYTPSFKGRVQDVKELQKLLQENLKQALIEALVQNKSIDAKQLFTRLDDNSINELLKANRSSGFSPIEEIMLSSKERFTFICELFNLATVSTILSFEDMTKAACKKWAETAPEENRSEILEQIVRCEQMRETTLDLSSKNLTSLPPFLFVGLAHLEELDLSFNQLTTFYLLNGFPRLNVVNLAGNRLHSVHIHPLGFLPLKELYLEYNPSLKEIPGSLEKFEELVILTVNKPLSEKAKSLVNQIKYNKPFLNAVLEGNLSKVRSCLEKGASPLAIDGLNYNALHISCTMGYLTISDLLLKKGIPINSKGLNGFTPLHLAARAGQTQTVIQLLQKGADTNLIDNLQQTPLHLACSEENLAIVMALVENGALIDAKNHKAQSALHIACSKGNTPIVKYLLANHANVDALHRNGNNALHVAAATKNYHLIPLLMNKGLSLFKENDNGQTPFDLIATENVETVVEDILKNKLKNFLRHDIDLLNLIQAVLKNDIIEIKRTLDLWNEGCDVAALRELGLQNSLTRETIEAYRVRNFSPDRLLGVELHSAIIDLNIDAVKEIIANGAYIETVSSDGWTPLTRALIYHRFGTPNTKLIIKILEQNRADSALANEIIDRIFLGQVAGIDKIPNILIKGQEFEISIGLPPAFSMKQLASLFLEFLKSHKIPGADTLLTAISHPIVKGDFDVLNPPGFVKKNCEIVMNNIINDKPTVILGGTRDHAIQIVIDCDPQDNSSLIITICNRGEGGSLVDNNKVEAGVVYVIKKENFKTEILLSLIKMHPDVSDFSNSIDTLLGAYQEKSLGFSQKIQESRNCTWASSKTALLALFLNVMEEDKAFKLYKTFTRFARDYILDQYKKKPLKSEAFIKQIEDKYRSKLK